ncbi:hypothetical protein [Desulfogranum mediterraneum]|uniref:hypothetical protein n=1 Tax=Desulfogranum mediterraneum TaxID=160661 RepID=UPI0004901906|nr:hypothetical protein [Desulfogranum mediterraneum]
MNSGRLYPVIVLIFCSFFISGCSLFQSFSHSFKSTDHFITHKKDSRIKYEAGAEKLAAELLTALPLAVQKVEEGQYAPFPENITIYACESGKSFEEMTGRKVSAMAYRESIFLSPEILDHPGNVTSYLVHELSHLHFYQHLGGYGYITIPAWFTEGLAVYVSDGGGAERVREDEARAYIRSGNHFIPYAQAGLRDLIVPKYASYWKIDHPCKHHMFYLQCMLFVAFLEQEDPESFKSFVLSLVEGTAFKTAFQSSFKVDLAVKWDDFKRKNDGQSTAQEQSHDA